MTDHREDIREAARRYTEHARFALAADRDELPHPFTPSEDDPDTCETCDGWDPDDDAHDVPAGFDPDEYADGLAGLLLDADALTAPDDPERWRVELSLTVGGPTVYVVADSRWTSVTFHHSWGRDGYTGRVGEVYGDPSTYGGLHRVDLYGDDAAVWLDIAAQCAGVDL